jgi:excisionase family DNA binding protein
MEEQQERREYVTVDEAARLISVHPQTVRRWLRSGQMLGNMISRTAGYRIRRDEVERVLSEGLREGKLEAA